MTTEQSAPSADDTIAVLKSRVRDLEAVLNQNNVDIALAFRLTPALANLLGLLLAVPLVTPDAIQHRLEIATDPKVAIHRLRNMLKPWAPKLNVAPSEVLIQGRRHVGYWIEPNVKERMKAFVGAAAGLPAEVADAA
jgi:hypothetical protein